MKSKVLIMLALCILVNAHAADNLEPSANISNLQPRRDINGEIIDAHDGCLEFF